MTETPVIKRKAGRPPGSKNKKKPIIKLAARNKKEQRKFLTPKKDKPVKEVKIEKPKQHFILDVVEYIEKNCGDIIKHEINKETKRMGVTREYYLAKCFTGFFFIDDKSFDLNSIKTPKVG